MVDPDELKALRGEVYKKLAFAFKVIEVTVRVEKPKLKQPGWHRMIRRDKREMDLADEVRMPPPSFTAEEMTRADAILDIFGKLEIRTDDRKVLSHYVSKRHSYGAIHRYCEKHGFSKQVYYKRRDRASMILIKSDEWQKI